LRLEEFAEKWDGKYPTISPAWRRNWERIVPFLAYPDEIRRVIYTTNAIESLNRGLRKIIKNRGSFPTDEAAMKLLYLAIQNISQKWNRPIKEWRAALNRFAIVFEGRLPIV
jgi:putative transposase